MTKKTLKNKLDKKWSEKIRSKKFCEVCGKPANNPHHVCGRKNLALRWDERNGCLLCFQHHTGGKESAHQDPIFFLNWFKSVRPQDYEYLSRKRTEITHYKISDLEELLNE